MGWVNFISDDSVKPVESLTRQTQALGRTQTYLKGAREL